MSFGSRVVEMQQRMYIVYVKMRGGAILGRIRGEKDSGQGVGSHVFCERK